MLQKVVLLKKPVLPPRIFTVRWVDEDRGMRVIQVQAETREQALETVQDLLGVNFVPAQVLQ